MGQTGPVRCLPRGLDRPIGIGHPGGMMIYKILTADQWHELQRTGSSAGAPVDVADGFVHFSTAEQAADTAARHFGGQSDLWVLAIRAAPLGQALRWEPSRGGALFPHLYAPLRLADVVWAERLSEGPDGRHRMPERMV